MNPCTQSNAVIVGIQTVFRVLRPPHVNLSSVDPTVFSAFWWRVELYVGVRGEWLGHQVLNFLTVFLLFIFSNRTLNHVARRKQRKPVFDIQFRKKELYT